MKAEMFQVLNFQIFSWKILSYFVTEFEEKINKARNFTDKCSYLISP